METSPAILHSTLAGEQLSQSPSANPDLVLPETEEEGGDYEIAQPTLTDFLRAVHTSTTSVHTLQEEFGSTKEELRFIRHDIQKVRERTKAGEGRISDIEDKLAPPNGRHSDHSETY